MYSRGASFLGAKRPREEHESADRAEALGLAVGYPSSMVAEVGNNAAHYVEGEHNSPPRHSPGVTPGGYNIHRTRSFDEVGDAEHDRMVRGFAVAATVTSCGAEGEDPLDPCGAATAPVAVETTPTPQHRHRRVDSLGGDGEADITLSPGELGGSQYIMSPGDHLASALRRTQSTMSDGHSCPALPSTVEEVAAEEVRTSQRLYPIFVKGRKVVHLVRHGQSTYNEAISGPGSWDEPNIFDAPLTALGTNQADGLGTFLSKLPKDTVWVTSALTRAMETCVHGYKASLKVKLKQMQNGAAVEEAAGGGGGSGGQPAGALGRSGRKSRLSHGGWPSGSNGGGGGNGSGSWPGVGARASDENGYLEATPMGAAGVPPGSRYAPCTRRGGGGGGGDTGDYAGVRHNGQHQYHLCDENTPAPKSVGGGEVPCLRVEFGGGELAPDAAAASPSEASAADSAAAAAWGDRVIVHPHLSEKLSTSGDIGRCKGVLINEFPLLGLGLSRLPGDVWWYSKPNRPNDAERETFGSHEPSSKFKERVGKFRHWLMSREDKVFVVFGHSTFFKELTGGQRSLKNCEVHTFHL